MAQMGLQTKGRRRFKRTTQRAETHRCAPNLLAGNFTATQPNEKWVADITYIPTDEGWLYLAGIQDVFSQRIVGWPLGSTVCLSCIIPTKAASIPVMTICACLSKTTSSSA